jgi:GDP-L-fucose synthase
MLLVKMNGVKIKKIIKNKMLKSSKIFVAGHRGLVGSAIVRDLYDRGYNNIVTKTHKELDLTEQKSVNDFFENEKPEYVFLCAAKVGGIVGNTLAPAEFIYNNVMIASNVINASYKFGVKKLLNMGSTCIYPKITPMPVREEYLLTGALEPSNEPYAIAKISALKMCHYYNKQYNTNYINVMPQNQYGIGDNFNMQSAHLLPMVMRRFHLAKLLANNDFESIKKDLQKNKIGWELDDKINYNDNSNIESILNQIGALKDKVILWGDGSVYREFTNSDDTADCCIYLMENKNANEIGEFVNITGGSDIQLKDLFLMVKEIVGFKGKIEYDTTKPNGTPRRLLSDERIKKLGWQPKIPLEKGIKDFYSWYVGVNTDTQ